MIRRDDQFATGGLTWTRRWVGDNSGRYEWTAGKCRAWCESRRWIENERTGRADEKAVYRAEVGGRILSENFPTLLNAMRACVLKQAVTNGNSRSLGAAGNRPIENRGAGIADGMHDDAGHG